MKRYIRYINASEDVDIDTSMFAGTPFVCDTDTSYYNDFLNTKKLQYMQDNKNRTGEIVMMSPTEYFEQCSKYGFSGGEVDVNHVMQGRRADTESLNWLQNHLDNGGKFYLPYINYADHCQEGLHRMMVVGDKYGWDKKFPVLLVTVYDSYVERQNKLFKEYLSFRDHDFEKLCENSAFEEFADWTGIPDNRIETDIMLSGLENRIIEDAKSYEDGYDIEVATEIEETDGVHLLHIYITGFDELDTSDRNEGCQLILEDYISTGNSIPQTDDLDDIDLDDLDLSDLFFKN